MDLFERALEAVDAGSDGDEGQPSDQMMPQA
jgi:hypothetical protein